MKKMISLILAAALIFGLLTACGSGTGEFASGSAAEEGSETKLRIVTTIFPLYDWAVNILGENAPHAEVSMLLDNGVDLHSYQPTVEDILKISDCDLFIYVGGESDAWVDDALKEAVNPDMVVINLMDVLGDFAKEEEIKEGMQEDGKEGDEEETEWDEHVWLSIRNAKLFCETIEQTLETLDPDCTDIYRDNLETYSGELDALDREYEAAVSEAPVKTLLFGDRFPFRYLTDDYGLDYYAAFVGCSAETEASFETILFLAKKVDELALHAVMTIDGSDQKLAQTIVQSTEAKDQDILTMDSMQSVTAKRLAEGADYLSIMKDNLQVLKEALK